MFTNDDLNSDLPTTECIPAVLMAPYLGKGHVLYTDNYYTSPSLATYFLSNQTHLCGTIRCNRKNYPKEITSEELDKGTVVFYLHTAGHPMLACKYHAIKDTSGNKAKMVFMLSTCHQPAMEPMVKLTKDGDPVMKPVMVKSYNSHMAGVKSSRSATAWN